MQYIYRLYLNLLSLHLNVWYLLKLILHIQYSWVNLLDPLQIKMCSFIVYITLFITYILILIILTSIGVLSVNSITFCFLSVDFIAQPSLTWSYCYFFSLYRVITTVLFCMLYDFIVCLFYVTYVAQYLLQLLLYLMLSNFYLILFYLC